MKKGSDERGFRRNVSFLLEGIVCVCFGVLECFVCAWVFFLCVSGSVLEGSLLGGLYGPANDMRPFYSI